MAKPVLGNKGMESAVRAKPVGEAVLLLARSYDKLVRDLEYTLSHLPENTSDEGGATRTKEGS